MKIRLANKSDFQAIEKFCKHMEIEFPSAQTILLAFNSSNDIVGLLGIEHVVKLEPLATTEPVVANNLYYSALGILVNAGVTSIEAFVSDEKIAKLKAMYERLGFIFTEHTNRFIKHTI